MVPNSRLPWTPSSKSQCYVNSPSPTMMASPHLFHVPSHPDFGMYTAFPPQGMPGSTAMPPYFAAGHPIVDHYPAYIPTGSHSGGPAILRYPMMDAYRPLIRMGIKEGSQITTKTPTFMNPYASLFPTRFSYASQETMCISPDSPNPSRPLYIQSPYSESGPSPSPAYRELRKDSSLSPHPILILPSEMTRKRSYQDSSPHEMSSGESVISPGFDPGSYAAETDYMSRSKKAPFMAPGQFLVPALILPPKPSSIVPIEKPKDPAYFNKGSIIQLGTGELRRVEDLTTDDFIQSADMSTEVKLDHSKVVKIEEYPSRGVVILTFTIGEQKVQVTVEAGVEHPFFVFRRGWSSTNPEKSFLKYNLSCHKLRVGDVCVSLTHKEQRKKLPPKAGSSKPQTFLVPTMVPSGKRSNTSTPVNYPKIVAKEDDKNSGKEKDKKGSPRTTSVSSPSS